jgi:hypothetical protein
MFKTVYLCWGYSQCRLRRNEKEDFGIRYKFIGGKMSNERCVHGSELEKLLNSWFQPYRAEQDISELAQQIRELAIRKLDIIRNDELLVDKNGCFLMQRMEVKEILSNL